MTSTTLLGPALLAGAVAIAATMAVERFGGRSGGLLATLPTTIVPAAWGMMEGAEDVQAFRDSVGAVPLGMLVNAGFLWTWRVLPPRLPEGPLAMRLAGMSAVSLTAWGLLAALGVFVLDLARGAGVSVLGIGVAAMGVTIAVGALAARGPAASAGPARRVPPVSLLARGIMAALAIAVSTALAASGSELLAGMASVFPAIFLTTMVSLWWSQGDALPVSAVGPMMLGSASVSAYALAAAWLIPTLGVVGGSLASWVVAVCCVTVPAWRWTRR